MEDKDEKMDKGCLRKTESGERKTRKWTGGFAPVLSRAAICLPSSSLRFASSAVDHSSSPAAGPASSVLRPHSSVRAFTLVELIVVLAIISLTMILAATRIGTNWKQVEDRDFLRQFTETLKRSRLFAMNSGRPVTFRLNGGNRAYGVENPPDQPIPLNAEIFSENLQKEPESGDFIIVFYPDGSFIGNDFEVVFDHERTYHVYIHPLFGTVNLERTK
jgi:prepilin-type N-terminal cleavage/methylation domain-containing protein